MNIGSYALVMRIVVLDTPLHTPRDSLSWTPKLHIILNAEQLLHDFWDISKFCLVPDQFNLDISEIRIVIRRCSLNVPEDRLVICQGSLNNSVLFLLNDQCSLLHCGAPRSLSWHACSHLVPI